MVIDGRCDRCDSRYCGDTCGDIPGNLYVVGAGWLPEKAARKLAREGRWVDGVNRSGHRGGSTWAQHGAGEVRVTLDRVPGQVDLVHVTTCPALTHEVTLRVSEGSGRAAANAAYKAGLRGGTWADATVAAAFAAAAISPEYWEETAYVLLNEAGGRCPDGCCGPGRDYEGTPVSEGLDAALRRYRQEKGEAA